MNNLKCCVLQPAKQPLPVCQIKQQQQHRSGLQAHAAYVGMCSTLAGPINSLQALWREETHVSQLRAPKAQGTATASDDDAVHTKSGHTKTHQHHQEQQR